MSLMSSQFGPDDMEALFWGPSILTADPLRSLLDPDEMMASPSEEPSSPLSSLSSPSSQFSSLSPPSSPTPPLPDKVDGDVPTLPWVAANPLNQANMNSGDVKDDSFVGMDWMAETMDLSDFDLDSFISSCNPENTPGSPDELVSSLDCFEPLADPVLDAPAPTLEASTHMALVPEVQTELEIKTEPPSPVPSPSVLPPASPASTLELGSEVDVAEVDMPIPKETPQVTRIVLSLSPTRIVLLLAPPKQEVGISQAPSCAVELPNSGSGTSLTPKAFQANSSRTQPYPTTSRATRSKLIPEVAVVPAASGGSKARSRVQEKKQRKMEQNKTAATRYRLKKRAEQECLHTEYAKLEERNRELVEKVDSITKEIQYLKELMEEVRVAKQRKGLADGNGRKF